MTLGPAVRDGENVFGVVHIFASFNDTFIVSVTLFFSCFNCDHSHHHSIYIADFFLLLYLQLQHVTDLSGRETLVRITAGMKGKAEREMSPHLMQA